jgi:succinoglycan biosynthesis transport protein ExoP
MDSHPELKPFFPHFLRVIRVRLGLVILVFLLVVMAAGIATYSSPRQYRSFATIEVQPEMTPVRIFENQAAVNDPKFSQSQFQIMLRKGVLYPVIERLDLENKWGSKGKKLPKGAAYDKLRSMLSLVEIRNTNLIEIDVFSTDPQEAALLSNTIAEVYMQQRIAEQQDTVSKGLDQLRDEVKQKEETLSQAYVEASRLRTQANIVDPNPESLDNSGTVEDSSVITNQQKVNETRSEIATLRSRVAELDRLTSENLMRSAGQLNLHDPIIEAKLPIYQTAQAEKAKLLSSGLGANHPDVKAQQAQIDTIAQQLREQIDSIRIGFVTQLAIAENTLKAMEANLQSSQAQQQAMKTASAQYLDAKYKYIQGRKLLESAKSRLDTESMERAMPQKPAFIRDPAEPALFPSKPSVKMNMLLGIAAGIILGISLAFFLEYLDTSVKTMEEIEKSFELRVLAVIPKGINHLPRAEEDSADAEAYRLLKTNVDFDRKKTHATAFTVISGGASEGKSTTVCNLGSVWAASGQRVLIIDGDMRRPVQHRLLEVSNRVGLNDYLKGNASLDEVIFPSTLDKLYLLPAGSASTDVVSLLHSKAMKHLMETVRERYDVVLVDCPPILGVSDASILVSMADSSIIVVQHRRFPGSMLMRVKRGIENNGGHLLGVVLNKVDVRYDENYRFYTSYNRYYTNRNNGKKQTAKTAAKIPGSFNSDEY